MRSTYGSAGRLFSISAILTISGFLMLPALAQQDPATAAHDPLAKVLLEKGILTPDEVRLIDQASTPQQANERMARFLLDKGVISAKDYEQIAVKTAAIAQPAAPKAPQPQPQTNVRTTNPPPSAAELKPAGFLARVGTQKPPLPTEPGAPSVVEKSPVKTVVSAITPIRPLPVGGIGRTVLVPAFKADGIGLAPYGFIKATAIEDSSSPNGDDFSLPGFLTDTGPDGAPDFHIKARSSRVGSNFVWYESSTKWSITGKIEMDFEGNFNRSDNRNLSSVRSSNPSLRLAWGRLDFSASDTNTFSALFGQDWTPFASSTLPNMLETTGLGIAFGTLYERTPQMRVGYTHKTAEFQIMPEFALTLPAVGLTPSAANMSEQLGYGERQGSDSNRPDIEGRLVGQWQLDHAPGVPPAQIIFSGERGDRTAIVLASAIPAPYQKTFAAGLAGNSHTDGWDFEWQLPSRYATLVGKFYSGSELRYFFAGQLYSFFNDTDGLNRHRLGILRGRCFYCRLWNQRPGTPGRRAGTPPSRRWGIRPTRPPALAHLRRAAGGTQCGLDSLCPLRHRSGEDTRSGSPRGLRQSPLRHHGGRDSEL
jgi:hypothetical protein